MNEWNKLYESVPTLDTPVWAGWFNADGSFTSGIFVLADNGVDNICIWCRCAESVSYDDFGGVGDRRLTRILADLRQGR